MKSFDRGADGVVMNPIDPEMIDVVSKPGITPEAKAQADSKAQQPRQDVSIARILQRRHRGSEAAL